MYSIFVLFKLRIKYSVTCNSIIISISLIIKYNYLHNIPELSNRNIACTQNSVKYCTRDDWMFDRALFILNGEL